MTTTQLSTVGDHDQHLAAELACLSMISNPVHSALADRTSQRDRVGPVCVLRDILDEATSHVVKHRRLRTLWSALHYALGLPAAIATTIGAIGLSAHDGIGISGIYAVLGSGIFSAAVTFLRCPDLRDRHDTLCIGWTHLADQARLALFDYSEQREKDSDGRPLDPQFHRLVLKLNHEKIQLLRGVRYAGPQQPPKLHPGPRNRPTERQSTNRTPRQQLPDRATTTPPRRHHRQQQSKDRRPTFDAVYRPTKGLAR